MTRYGNIIKFQGGKAELLPNGFVRVDCNSGLVRMWQHLPGEAITLRSGQGGRASGETIAVAELIG